MSCYSSDHMADEDYWYPCLLVPMSTGFLQARSHRSRLYYLPNDTACIANAPDGYFPIRVARPSVLCIASVAADSNVSRSAVSFENTSGLSGKLARAGE
jgi:hypothetical protein